MKIKIEYVFYTDGDYSLKNPEYFGRKAGEEVSSADMFCDYAGEMTFDAEPEICKSDARTFLTRLLCDGIEVSWTHFWLVRDFCDMIDALINFIYEHDSGMSCEKLTGDYDGTYIKVEFLQ